MNSGLHSSSSIAVAFVHHANQYLITDGYEGREGVSEMVEGEPAGARPAQDEQNRSGANALVSKKRGRGFRRILEIHEMYRVPLNLHVSGTLLESLKWHRPSFLERLEDLSKWNLIEFVGSTYGQNMMQYFSKEHNRHQLEECLRVYERLVRLDPKTVKVFWPPERLWNTSIMAPQIKDSGLQNGGYDYAIVDDRLLLPTAGNQRRIYDAQKGWDPNNFLIHEIKGGCGIYAVPISNNLRQNIPPRDESCFDRIKLQLRWLLDMNQEYDNGMIAVYADDMEKAAGVGGWDAEGPQQYEALLKWIAGQRWIKPIRISSWARSHRSGRPVRIETGTYQELATQFGAGEDYDNWYRDGKWRIYRKYYEWAERSVKEKSSERADSSLLELAWKILLACSWETAWHTPRVGAHGRPDSDGGPSAWAKSLASHLRLAAIVAEAALWVEHKEEGRHHPNAHLKDLDCDGSRELVLKNDKLFAVFSPRCGGRLVYLFGTDRPPGTLLVGNPIDDWNLLEDLHGYMETPPNHPGALSDVGFERDNFKVNVSTPKRRVVHAAEVDVDPNSRAFGLVKQIELEAGANRLSVLYTLPEGISEFQTLIGVSPDYLKLLRDGRPEGDAFCASAQFRRWSNVDSSVWVRLEENCCFLPPPVEIFGHGYVARIGSRGAKNFRFSIGVDRPN